MKVKIKSFDVEMEVKNNGIELEVRSANGQDQLGDLFVTKTGLIWCKGRIYRENGKNITWKKFIEWADNQ